MEDDLAFGRDGFKTIYHDFFSAILVAAVDHVNLGSDTGKVDGFFNCRVAAADDGHSVGIGQRLRNGDYATTVSMKESLRFYLRNRAKGVDGKNLVMGLIADQNPPRRPDSRWFRFLNQDTIFFDGGEKLALRCNLPVFFVKMNRLRRGRYEMSFELIYDGKEEVAEYEITQRYVRKLERMICECPELWMWSHRRWKHKRTHAGR